MSILLNKESKVVISGITGREGSFHARQMIEYGTNVVAGVTPGKGGQILEAGDVTVPVFNSVREAVEATGADTSMIIVPARFAVDAIYETVDAGVPFVVCLSEYIPVLDMIAVRNYIDSKDGVRLLGPNCPGLLTPGEAKLGFIPGSIAMSGPVGVVSKSGTLTYEVIDALTRLGIGQTTCIGIGGDPINGTDFIDVLEMFENDPDTEHIVMIGEIGGNAEEQAAEYIKAHVTKPVTSFIAGRTAPPGRRMGHAGAIVEGSSGSAEGKIEALRAAGVPVADNPDDIAKIVAERMGK